MSYPIPPDPSALPSNYIPLVNFKYRINNNNNNDPTFITSQLITIDEIKSEISSYPVDIGLNDIEDYRNKETIDALLNEEKNNIMIFYVSSHGTCLRDKYIFSCPKKTLILQTGAYKHCMASILSGYDASIVNSTNLRPTLYEMIGICRDSPNFLESILFSTPDEQVPNKSLTYDLNEDDPFKFGVFWMNSDFDYRINNTDLDALFERECTTNEVIEFINTHFPNTVNIFFFSSCSDIKNKSTYTQSYKLWTSPSHGESMSILTHGRVGSLSCGHMFSKNVFKASKFYESENNSTSGMLFTGDSTGRAFMVPEAGNMNMMTISRSGGGSAAASSHLRKTRRQSPRKRSTMKRKFKH